ncbi:acetolactate synthase-1/2/3 large subunit [Rhodococcus sp. AG1013]|uniref:thiamine pyrophosphate-binding protein n=1 Tax=Rhodococcus sp. AG1013 TaxID=2183996 RepID=UPI000E0BDC4B|nr:thiamine pyrophosphate-binding protein [Rhodococcus sp. AG1013]RDI17196.1 acetolactate synthase-1/2/3 large subunit [Rhodococcus sp. AG1013]
MDTGARHPIRHGSRVVDAVVDAVADLGVRHIFGVDGANIEDLYDALFATDRRVQGVVAKHEFAAATMADGYARTTSGLGVVAATSGGGAMNLVAGLAESYTSRVPVLALIGQPPTTLEGTGAFQDSSGKAGTINAVRLFTEVSRYCARVERPDDLADHLERAVAAARSGGPAVLLLPKDIQQSAVDGAATFRPPPRRSGQDPAGLARIRDLLAAARRTGKVVLIAGDQVARDDARPELHALAAAVDAAVGVAPDAKDVYAADQHGFCGVTGTMGHTELLEVVRRSTLCLLIGTRLPATARTGLDTAAAAVPVASVGAESPYLPTVHATSLDLREALAELAEAFSAGRTPDAATHGGSTPLQVPVSAGPGMRYREAVEAIAAMMPAGSDTFADAGNTGAAVVHHLPVPRGGRFVVALGMGGMGYSFGAAIGATFARGSGACGAPREPRRQTFVIAGDGAFFMHGLEIHTAIEHHLPITFVVFNNNAHAMCVTREQLFYGDRYSFNRFRPSRIAEGVAAMFPSLPSYPARTCDQLFDALEAATATSGPAFIAVDCDPDEIPPFVPFLERAPHSRGGTP